MRSRFTPVATTLLLVAALLVAVPTAASATTPTPTPRIPRGLPAAIEPLGGYVGQVTCQPTIRPGTAKLAKLLAYTYRNYNATSWASTYACGTDGTRSEHYDGRAIDWMVDVHSTKQHAAAKAAIAWLLATDTAGNRFAMARRLGVMYLIYDNRMWGSWDGRWEDYNGCSKLPQHAYDNACHRTHMHISLTWNGAMARTSYWTRSVAPTDYGHCRLPDLNWAFLYTGRNLVPCPSYPLVRPKAGASATKKALVNYSGAAVRAGWSGPAVTAVQRGLGVAATGVFDPATVTAVKWFQHRHALGTTGAMNVPTWRALLRVTR
jgi:peptidoglycan hydrolase-like protein with peptidoglycan-binding domain